jgi:hypothetical protein
MKPLLAMEVTQEQSGSAVVGGNIAFILWNLSEFGVARTTDKETLTYLVEKLGPWLEIGQVQEDTYNWGYIWPLKLKGTLTLTKKQLKWEGLSRLNDLRYDLGWLLEAKQIFNNGKPAERAVEPSPLPPMPKRPRSRPQGPRTFPPLLPEGRMRPKV